MYGYQFVWAVSVTWTSKLISPFRLEDFGLQDWHWALDDIDDDCSSIHFWWLQVVTVCSVCCAVRWFQRQWNAVSTRHQFLQLQSQFAVILKKEVNTGDQIFDNVVFRVVAHHDNYIRLTLIFLKLLRIKVLFSRHIILLTSLNISHPIVTLYPLTWALAGQMASKWGEKNPTVDTGTSDGFSPLVLPLPRRFPVNESIPECVYVCLQPKSVFLHQTFRHSPGCQFVVVLVVGYVHICWSQCTYLLGFLKFAGNIWLLTW